MRGTQREDYARLTREAVAVRTIVPVRTPVSTRKRTRNEIRTYREHTNLTYHCVRARGSESAS